MDKIYKIIPKRSLIYSLICLGVVLILFIAGIIPEYFSLARLDQQIRSIQFQIEEHKNLYPIYQMFQNKTSTQDPRSLPFPQRIPLTRTQMDDIPATFREIAKKANVDMVSASPDLNSLGGESGFLPIIAVIKGDFFNFRKFLIGLGEVPCLDRIEEIQIHQNEDAMEFNVKVWLVLS